MRTARLRGLSRWSGVPVCSEVVASKQAASRVGPRLLLLLGRSILRLRPRDTTFPKTSTGVGAADSTGDHAGVDGGHALTRGVGGGDELGWLPETDILHSLPSACQNNAPRNE